MEPPMGGTGARHGASDCPTGGQGHAAWVATSRGPGTRTGVIGAGWAAMRAERAGVISTNIVATSGLTGGNQGVAGSVDGGMAFAEIEFPHRNS